MKLLVVGEGTDELGRIERNEDGVVSALVRNRFEDRDRRIAFDTVAFARLDETRGLTGERRRGDSIAAEARRRGCDGVVVLRDGDRRAEPRLAELRTSLVGSGLPHAVGVAIETLEAWLLSDPRALEHALGGPVDVPSDPEMLWGTRTGSTSNHPKAVWKRLCTGHRRDQGGATKVEVARRTSIATLRARCPAGFAPFDDALVRAFPAFDIVVAADLEWGIGKDNAPAVAEAARRPRALQARSRRPRARAGATRS